MSVLKKDGLAHLISRFKSFFDTLDKNKLEEIKVESLPTDNILDYVIYCVPCKDPSENYLYDKYIHINGEWELISRGNIGYTKDEIDEKVDGLQDTLEKLKEMITPGGIIPGIDKIHIHSYRQVGIEDTSDDYHTITYKCYGWGDGECDNPVYTETFKHKYSCLDTGKYKYYMCACGNHYDEEVIVPVIDKFMLDLHLWLDRINKEDLGRTLLNEDLDEIEALIDLVMGEETYDPWELEQLDLHKIIDNINGEKFWVDLRPEDMKAIENLIVYINGVETEPPAPPSPWLAIHRIVDQLNNENYDDITIEDESEVDIINILNEINGIEHPDPYEIEIMNLVDLLNGEPIPSHYVDEDENRIEKYINKVIGGSKNEYNSGKTELP